MLYLAVGSFSNLNSSTLIRVGITGSSLWDVPVSILVLLWIPCSQFTLSGLNTGFGIDDIFINSKVWNEIVNWVWLSLEVCLKFMLQLFLGFRQAVMRLLDIVINSEVWDLVVNLPVWFVPG